jgi:hypothetical protein
LTATKASSLPMCAWLNARLAMLLNARIARPCSCQRRSRCATVLWRTRTLRPRRTGLRAEADDVRRRHGPAASTPATASRAVWRAASTWEEAFVRLCATQIPARQRWRGTDASAKVASATRSPTQPSAVSALVLVWHLHSVHWRPRLMAYRLCCGELPCALDLLDDPGLHMYTSLPLGLPPRLYT